MMNNQKEDFTINEKENILKSLVSIFSTRILEPIKNKKIYLKHIEQRIYFIQWANKKFTLQTRGMPKYVFKRDIFYCEFGYNIGSEQNNNRPVVILQNDKGNKSSTITIVAPITTHDKSIIKNENGQDIIEFVDENGNKITKKLDYYEIPVVLENNPKVNITGYINLAQIRAVSKKRLHNSYIARITNNTQIKIDNAIKRLL